MANEITYGTTLSLSNDELKFSKNYTGIRITQAAQGLVSNVQAIGTVEEALDLGDLTTPGVSQMKNLEAAGGETIEVGTVPSSAIGFIAFIELKPGEAWSGRLATTTPYAKSSGGTPKLDYTILEA